MNAELGEWELLQTDAELCKMVDRAGNGGHLDFYIDNVVDKKIEPLKTQPHVLVRPRPNILAGIINLTLSNIVNLFNYLCIALLHINLL